MIIDVNTQQFKDENASNDDETVVLDDLGLPASLRFNKKAMDISIKPRKRGSIKGECTFGPNMKYQKDSEISEIVCMPNMEEFGGLPEEMDDLEDDDDVMICNEFLQEDIDISNFEQAPLLQYSAQNQMRLNRAVTYTRIAPKPSMMSNGHPPEEVEKHLLQGLYLRNPRGSHARTYTQEELFMALNAIKQGLSIYRASQQFKVPRKTLRNWMKRWQIKSVYPMPAQLKRAAEKRKEHQDQMYQAHNSVVGPSSSFIIEPNLKNETNEHIMTNITL